LCCMDIPLNFPV